MSEQTTQLRTAYRDALEQGLAQARALLADYQRLYPPSDYGQVQQTLAQQPVMGVNVHTPFDPQAPGNRYGGMMAPEAFAAGGPGNVGVEAIPLGDIADPVSQLAFLAGGPALRASKAALEQMATPGPSLQGGFLSNELGGMRLPNPQAWPRGAPLPEVPPFSEGRLTPAIREARGAGVVGYTGGPNYTQFKQLGAPFLGDLSDVGKRAVYKNAVDLLKSQQRLSPGGLASSGDLLELFQQGKGTGDWYAHARQTLWDMFGEDGDLVARLIGATSPSTPVRRNIDLALTAYERYKLGLDPAPPGTFGAHAGNIRRAIAGEPLSGPKVSRFAANIMGDPHPITVDTWMMKIFGMPQAGSGSPTLEQYRMVSEWTEQLAKQMGVNPREMQGALWVGGKLAHGPMAGKEVLEDIPKPLAELVERRVLELQPRMEQLTGALGQYFTDLAPEARKRLLQTLALSTLAAQGMQGYNIGDEHMAGASVLQRLGMTSPDPASMAYMSDLMHEAPGFGE